MVDPATATRGISEWLDGFAPDRRAWAITCMTSAAEGGCLDVDGPTYSALPHDGIATVEDLEGRMAVTDIRKIPGIGPARLSRIRGAIATYESGAR